MISARPADSSAAAGIVHAYVDPSWTIYGQQGALIERFTGDMVVDGIWQYQKFVHGRQHPGPEAPLQRQRGAARRVELWAAGYFVESFGYDSDAVRELPHRSAQDGRDGLDTDSVHGAAHDSQSRSTSSSSTRRSWRHFNAQRFFL